MEEGKGRDGPGRKGSKRGLSGWAWLDRGQQERGGGGGKRGWAAETPVLEAWRVQGFETTLAPREGVGWQGE